MNFENEDIPKFEEPYDVLREGFQNKSKNDHDVQTAEETFLLNSAQREAFTNDKIFGSHMNMRLTMERMLLSQPQRLPGLPSSFIGLETHLGADEDMDFGDFLNVPFESTFEPKQNLHEVMEQRLGL